LASSYDNAPLLAELFGEDVLSSAANQVPKVLSCIGLLALHKAGELGSIEIGLEGTADTETFGSLFWILPTRRYAPLHNRSTPRLKCRGFTDRKPTLPAIYAHKTFNLGLPPTTRTGLHAAT
jgi:hypothetical protein